MTDLSAKPMKAEGFGLRRYILPEHPIDQVYDVCGIAMVRAEALAQLRAEVAKLRRSLEDLATTTYDATAAQQRSWARVQLMGDGDAALTPTRSGE